MCLTHPKFLLREKQKELDALAERKDMAERKVVREEKKRKKEEEANQRKVNGKYTKSKCARMGI